MSLIARALRDVIEATIEQPRRDQIFVKAYSDSLNPDRLLPGIIS
jgi:hypothetical protein